ncbi:hypothetical protein [Bradyrhizobium sp. STM 3557]|uniref:hypothetical protein n=1 Tax=Bradyrhizobium sp. STM 3557 TaxID=578920 RepID=UPI0038907C70
MLHTGFVFGIDNNIFHLPIMAGLYDEPQFHDDAFIQSLRYFASGVWLLLAHAEHYLDHIPALFLGLAWLSRLLSFLGFLCCASLIGITTRADKIVFSLLLCITSFLEGGSFAGLGGLFLNYFTHSELANGTILLAIYAAARGRITTASLLIGLTSFINAFMAVWLAAILSFVIASLLARRAITAGAICRQALPALLPCASLALPVLVNVLSNPALGQALDFDYVAYLREYFAEHILIDAIPVYDLLALTALALLGHVALRQLGVNARELRAAYCGVLGLYAAGIVLPYLFASQSLFNLHLLRSSAIVHLLAGLAVAAVVTGWLRDVTKPTFALGSIAVILLSAQTYGFALCMPLFATAPLLLKLQPLASPAMRAFGVAAIGFAALILAPVSAWQNFNANRLLVRSVTEWTELGNWARTGTPEMAMFLPPPRPDRDSPPETLPDAIARSRAAVFESTAHRRIWIDYKRGAAAMWSPPYYHIWRTRSAEIAALKSLDQRLAYAGQHGIDYLIEPCGAVPATTHPLFGTARLCVLPAQPIAANATP